MISVHLVPTHQVYAALNPLMDEVELFLEGFKEEQVIVHVQDINVKIVAEEIAVKG